MSSCKTSIFFSLWSTPLSAGGCFISKYLRQVANTFMHLADLSTRAEHASHSICFFSCLKLGLGASEVRGRIPEIVKLGNLRFKVVYAQVRNCPNYIQRPADITHCAKRINRQRSQRSFHFQFADRMVASISCRRMSVKTITALAANKLGKFLAKDFRRIFGPAHDDMAERLASLARSTIECLGRSDALYHNFEHTLQVTMVGRDILQGMTPVPANRTIRL